jgi:hypothetical protein
MPRLPDRFDLWIQKARETADPARQADWILGGLLVLKELYFLNIGTKANPLIAKTAIATDECVLIFTDSARILEFVEEHPAARKAPESEPPVITSPTAAALKWCLENNAGLIINPREEDTVMVPYPELAAFLDAWRQRGERRPAGFWIPHMTTQEEDFWQEHGL